jgi:hypothetical protein
MVDDDNLSDSDVIDAEIVKELVQIRIWLKWRNKANKVLSRAV